MHWIRIKVKIQVLWSLIWKAVDDHNGSPEDQKWSSGGSVDQWSQLPITLMRSRIRIRIRIKMKRMIRICIKVKRECSGSVTFWYGSVPLTNGSGSGSCSFRQWPSRRQQKIFFSNFSADLFLRYIYIIFQRLNVSHKTVEITFFLTIFAWWWEDRIRLTNGSGRPKNLGSGSGTLGKMDPDPDQSEKRDPHPRRSEGRSTGSTTPETVPERWLERSSSYCVSPAIVSERKGGGG